MFRRSAWVSALIVVWAFAAVAQEIPDAPSATRPQQPPAPATGPQTPPTVTAGPRPTGEPRTDDAGTVTPGGGPGAPPAGDTNDTRGELGFIIRKEVNQVVIPVTVRGDNGRLVEGLLRRDFSVLENGEEQKINFFTSDPFPLSAAIVLDLGMSDMAMQKINQTLGSLAGAFSEFDEVGFYTFGSTVDRKLDFSGMSDRLYTTMRRLKHKGRTGGVPVTSGPMASGPTVNGRPIDPGRSTVVTPPRESSVLNDAILRAALDLSKRDRTRRKIIIVVSEGREEGSRASYAEVRKVLLSNEITVYAVGVGEAALPVYRRLETIKLPGLPYGNILPKYADVTGGQVFAEFSRDAIERAYAHATQVARNQYTLGYIARSGGAGNYREIEVQVHRGGLKVKSKAGYYPLPPTSGTGQVVAR